MSEQKPDALDEAIWAAEECCDYAELDRRHNIPRFRDIINQHIGPVIEGLQERLATITEAYDLVKDHRDKARDERDEWKRKAEAAETERDEAIRKMTAREKKWDAMKKLTRQWHDLYHDMKRQLAAVREEYADYRKQQDAWREEAYRQLAVARDLCSQSLREICKHPVRNTELYLALKAIDAAREKGGAK